MILVSTDSSKGTAKMLVLQDSNEHIINVEQEGVFLVSSQSFFQ